MTEDEVLEFSKPHLSRCLNLAQQGMCVCVCACVMCIALKFSNIIAN